MEIGPNRVCETHSNFLKLDQLSIKIAGNAYVKNTIILVFGLMGEGGSTKPADKGVLTLKVQLRLL